MRIDIVVPGTQYCRRCCTDAGLERSYAAEVDVDAGWTGVPGGQDSGVGTAAQASCSRAWGRGLFKPPTSVLPYLSVAVCTLLRRRSELRLYALVPSICSSVCLSVCRRNAYTKMRFSQKVNNLERRSLLTTCRKSYTVFSKNPILDPQNSRWRTAAILKIVSGHYSAANCPILLKFCLGKQSFYRISEMGQISAFHSTLFFVFLMQFWLRLEAAFVSSPIHLFVGMR